MRLLAMDAALGSCSVALMDEAECLAVLEGGDSRSATASLPGMVQRLLARHGMGFDAVAVTVGPGSFTGLRGAIALAKGLALGAGVPVVGVTVAEALLAGRAVPPGRVAWVALDSRRAGRISLGRPGGMMAVSLTELPVPEQPVLVFGDAADQVVQALRQSGSDAVSAQASAISACAVGRLAWRRLAGEIPPCEVLPIYLEPPEARAASATRPAPA